MRTDQPFLEALQNLERSALALALEAGRPDLTDTEATAIEQALDRVDTTLRFLLIIGEEDIK